MPWLISTKFVDGMINAAKAQDARFDPWWRDEAQLEAWWDMMGYPAQAGAVQDVGCAAVPCGQGVAWRAWLMRQQSRGTGGQALWTLLAIAPFDGRDWSDTWKLNGGERLPAGWITKWRAGAGDHIARVPVAVGDWVGCRTLQGDKALLGVCLSVNDKGKALTVQLAKHDPTPVECDVLARHWFKFQSRDEALQSFWDEGRTSFPAYINMLAQAARRQKKLTGKADKRARPVEGLPDAVQQVQAARAPKDKPQPKKIDPLRQSLCKAMGAMVAAGMPTDKAQAWLDAQLSLHNV